MSQLQSMLAVPFTLTASDSIAIVISGTTYTATVAAGTYRVNLATSATDAIRVLQAALNAAPSLPGGVSFAVALDGDTGLVTITCTGATAKLPDLYNSVIGGRDATAAEVGARMNRYTGATAERQTRERAA